MQLKSQTIALSLLTVAALGVVAAPAAYAEKVDFDELREENLDKDAVNFDILRQRNLEKSEKVDFDELREENLDKDAVNFDILR
ncbi:hypothetical protein XM38_051450 [Halomicronema hongdechloris C2206]|uniref:Uncharacterized protein n=1 Tax=Halomicronema hongdechloris C2206 TaxID=1641165 RepID=A0A1Z3HV24_9CYAN|nr:hypothetical protein [Halomicronema hongdechloris]ASC74170.1 hypothetical protein XM38_051450 [Halomicronema hongdechloris C2206]